jgi:serine/threonine protein kinase
MDNDAIDLLEKLLDFNMQERITAKDALDHSYFINNQSDKESEATTFKSNLKISGTAYADQNEQNEALSLPDITNIFQPNILKRKRMKNQNRKN